MRGVDDQQLSFRSGRTAARGQGIAPRRSAPFSTTRSRPAPFRRRRQGRLLARVQPQGRGQGLDRHDLAQEIRRPRALAARTLCRDRGDAGAARADPRPFDRRPAIGPGDAALRPGGDPEKDPAAHRSGELCFCIGLSEPNSGSDVFAASTRATKTDGGWLVNGRKIWTERAPGRLHDRAVAHLALDQGKPSARADPVPGRDEDSGDHHPADHQPDRRA